MGGCMSKFHVVEYDAQMKHKHKKEEEAPYVKVEEVEDDATLKKNSGSKRSLSNLFKQDEDHQVKKEDIEEKDIIQKNETPNLSIDAVLSEKQKDPKAVEIQTVIVQDDVKPDDSQSCLEKMPEDPSKLETSNLSSDVSSMNQGSHVETEHLNISESNPSNSATEVGNVTVVENGAGTEVCESDDGTENQVKMSDTGTITKEASSSSGTETVVEKDKNSMNSGTGLPTNEVKNTTSDVEGINSDSNMQTSADNNIKIFQDSSGKVGVDHQVSDIEGKALVATLSASKNHALNISAETTLMSEVQVPTDGNSAATVEIEMEPIVDHKLSSKNVQDAESNAEDEHKNSVSGSIEDKRVESMEAERNQSDRASSADDFSRETSNITEHTHSMPVNNSVINKTDEEKIERKEASIVHSNDSTISTSVSTAPVVEMSASPLKELQDNSATEPLGTSILVAKGDEHIENKETKGLDGKTEKSTVNNEDLATKAGVETMDVDQTASNATQSDELGNNVHSSMMNEEELSKRNIPILDTASKENSEASSANLEIKLIESDKTFDGKNVEFPPVNDNPLVKDDLPSKQPADNC